MVILIDLDGTLTDTAHDEFKPMKDGQVAVDTSKIPLIKGAKEFVEWAKQFNHFPIIVSDSHPKYVKPIAFELFGIPYLSLADKPNTLQTRNVLSLLKEKYGDKFPDSTNKNAFIVIGDTWLDIELGRALNCKTVLTKFYKATSSEERDGIGNEWKHLKSGPTYVVGSFERIKEIIEWPIKYLLAAEAIFQGIDSIRSRKYKTDVSPTGVLTSFVSLGRQSAGECDQYGIADKYYEFQREGRTAETLNKLAQAVTNYLELVVKDTKGFSWDYLTYITDKTTTIPPNKMKTFVDRIASSIPKAKIFSWRDNINGSIRSQINFNDRKVFVNDNFFVDTNIDLNGKNTIVLDDQFTTGGTAYAVTDMLRAKGVKSVLFVTLFNLITTVASERTCPKCGTRLQVKINRNRGTRFLSCVPPKFKGTGCGEFIENID